MIEHAVDLGVVTAPSGVLVLGMASWIDYWPQLGGGSLSERAGAVASAGGGHVQDWLCELVGVPVARDTPLPVRATTAASPFDGGPTIAVLEVDLGLPWTADEPVLLGDLPVDRCGMVLGDAIALDSWTGDGHPSTDGLADVFYWGGDVNEVHEAFGGDVIVQNGSRVRGWLDLPLAEAEALADSLQAWQPEGRRRRLMSVLDEHNDFHRFNRAGWNHPLCAGAVRVAGCQVLGIGWDPGDHSMRHRGERAHGQVYPVTLRPGPEGRTVLRWTVAS
ncbi:hypothetical protein [Streptomyces sp. AS02]|uniref:hypothetical protein n=1 Tax=Streptomyces sp. AS02 TaxID=2938946 RepID=UPI002020B21D|nr:hypothetical protein [Streptomyces sp. AS02]MCL8014195.1 hypothetical protein [Streptomyces sp. AS02]